MANKASDKEGIRKRFLKTVDLLKKSNDKYTDTEAGADCGLLPSNFADIRAGRRGLTIQAIKSFKKANPEISLDYIICNTGTALQVDIPQTFSVKGKDIIVATEDASGNVTIPMINYKAAANYMTGYNSQEYFEELPPLTLPPTLVRSGQHYALQTVGDSMYPTLYDSDWVVCRLLDRSEWESVKNLYIYVLVSAQRGINIKRVLNRLKEHGFIRCKSDNRAHAPYNVQLEDLMQIWEVKFKLSAHLPDQNELLYNKVNRIEEELEEVKEVVFGKK